MEQKDLKTGVCKMCRQSVMIAPDMEAEYPSVTEIDELATLECCCEEGKKWREAKRQEITNTQFVSYAEHELAEFMKENDYKRVVVQDSHGNTAALLRMEKGDIKITTSLKKII